MALEISARRHYPVVRKGRGNIILEPMVWSERFSIHNEEIDNQHKKLFDLYNRVQFFAEDEGDKTRTLKALTDYAGFHFADEERVMESVGYPDHEFQRHKKQHELFLESLSQLKSEPLWKTLDFFREWLLTHVLAEDTKIGRFIEAKLPREID
jgi:hemerythrin-like metal-binding protein